MKDNEFSNVGQPLTLENLERALEQWHRDHRELRRRFHTPWGYGWEGMFVGVFCTPDQWLSLLECGQIVEELGGPVS